MNLLFLDTRLQKMSTYEVITIVTNEFMFNSNHFYYSKNLKPGMYRGSFRPSSLSASTVNDPTDIDERVFLSYVRGTEHCSTSEEETLFRLTR